MTSLEHRRSAWREQWEARHSASGGVLGPAAAVLIENEHFLPRQGRALDLACGSGRNALWLAGQGLETHAWDWSASALRHLREAARQRGLAVATAERDVFAHPPAPCSFDVIVVSHFLDRGLAEPLMAALRPQGLLFYQTFTKERVGAGGPCNERFLLQPNELLHLFAALRILVYREEGQVGDVGRGFRNEALLVAQRAQ
jgi:tellurite methyltransferase